MRYKKILFFIVFISFLPHTFSALNVDSLIQVYKTSGSDTAKARTLVRIAFELTNQDSDSALACAVKAIDLLDKHNDEAIRASATNMLGRIYFVKSDYAKAMDYFMKAKRMWEKLNNMSRVYTSDVNIGLINIYTKNYKKALEIFNRALEFKLKENDRTMITLIYLNIGLSYFNQGQYDSALVNNIKGLKYARETGSTEHLMILINNIGTVYSQLKQYEKAIEYYKQAVELAKQYRMTAQLPLALSNIGNTYTLLKQFDKAEYYLRAAIDSCKKSGSREYEKIAYDYISQMYEAKKDFESALKYRKRFAELSDSIYTIAGTSAITEMQSKYEADKKQQEIELLKKDNDLNEREKSLQRIIILSSFLGIALLLLLAVLIFNRYRLKQKSNDQLQLLNFELQKLSIVASKTDNGVLICNADGEMEWINEGYTRLLGYTIDDLKKKGRYLNETSSYPGIQELIKKSISTHRSVSYEAINTTREGEKLWIHSTLTPIFEQSGELNKIVVIDTDITLQKKAEEIIAKKNESILDSIHYAKSIQDIILPPQNKLLKKFSDLFIYYQPKDIVSGDFYWMGEKDDKILFAAADCTGHGVPGALMSILGFNLLENVLGSRQITTAAAFLNALDKEVKSTIAGTSSGSNMKNFMDISLIIYDKQKDSIQFAGAQNSLYQVRKDSVKEFKADRISLGESEGDGKEFTNHIIDSSPGDLLYLFSDGYVDQKGGPDKKKFYYGPFEKLILSLRNESMQRQKEILSETFLAWKGDLAQIDDVMVIGIKI